MFKFFVNLWEVKGFLKKRLGSTGGLYRSLRGFLKNLWAVNFFQRFRGPYVKIHRH
jgi:hypothetical protein